MFCRYNSKIRISFLVIEEIQNILSKNVIKKNRYKKIVSLDLFTNDINGSLKYFLFIISVIFQIFPFHFKNTCQARGK